MQKVLILSQSPAHYDTRVLRQIDWLKNNFEVYLAAQTIPIGFNERRFYKLKSFKDAYVGRISLLFQSIIARTFISSRYSFIHYFHRDVLRKMKHTKYDLIISHHSNTLPLGINIKKNSPEVKLIFDDREYTPTELEGNFSWELLHQPSNIAILKNFLKYTDKVITTGQGYANKYLLDYNISAEIILNAVYYIPGYNNKGINKQEIKLIHHGVLSRDRKPELMIELMKHLDPKYSLTFMVFGNDSLLKELKEKANGVNKKIQFISPVAPDKIAETLFNYDIGIYILPPINFSYLWALPSKIFDFIQARLPIIVGPSQEMGRLISRYKIGLVARSFDPKEIAAEINKLDLESMNKFKNKLNEAAYELSAEKNGILFIKLMNELLKKQIK